MQLWRGRKRCRCACSTRNQAHCRRLAGCLTHERRKSSSQPQVQRLERLLAWRHWQVQQFGRRIENASAPQELQSGRMNAVVSRELQRLATSATRRVSCGWSSREWSLRFGRAVRYKSSEWLHELRRRVGIALHLIVLSRQSADLTATLRPTAALSARRCGVQCRQTAMQARMESRCRSRPHSAAERGRERAGSGEGGHAWGQRERIECTFLRREMSSADDKRAHRPQLKQSWKKKKKSLREPLHSKALCLLLHAAPPPSDELFIRRRRE